MKQDKSRYEMAAWIFATLKRSIPSFSCAADNSEPNYV